MGVEHEVLRDLGWLDDGSERGDNQPPLTDDSGAPCLSVCYGPDTKPVCCESGGCVGGNGLNCTIFSVQMSGGVL
jgi:hypothetical protein